MRDPKTGAILSLLYLFYFPSATKGATWRLPSTLACATGRPSCPASTTTRTNFRDWSEVSLNFSHVEIHRRKQISPPQAAEDRVLRVGMTRGMELAWTSFVSEQGVQACRRAAGGCRISPGLSDSLLLLSRGGGHTLLRLLNLLFGLAFKKYIAPATFMSSRLGSTLSASRTGDTGTSTLLSNDPPFHPTTVAPEPGT